MSDKSELQTIINQIKIMLQMQHEMNLKVSPLWDTQGYEWYRAIWVECAEMLDHYGWKWWKQQTPDIAQVQLELVDIFHFGLSSKLVENSNITELATDIALSMQSPITEDDFKLTLERLASAALTEREFNISYFAGCLVQCDMNADHLFRYYVGKNALNFFRQDNGYKDGTYKKIWNGKEDNEYLVEIINRLDSSSKNFKDQVYQSLKAEYAAT